MDSKQLAKCKILLLGRDKKQVMGNFKRIYSLKLSNKIKVN